MRQSIGIQPTTSSSAVSSVPSQELIWVRDNSGHESQLSSPSFQPSSTSETIILDDEIEDGEIVESEINDLIDLLEESFAAVKKSRDVTKPKLFYEDRTSAHSGEVPKYKTFGDASMTDDDVVCLDSSQEIDDSVVFVSEEKPVEKFQTLAPPACLNNSTVKNLMDLVPSSPALNLRSSPNKSARRSREGRQKRVKLWKVMKDKKFAEAQKTGQNVEAKDESPKPSTSGAVSETSTAKGEKKPKELEKRIILIDGSNIAFSYTDDYGSRKTDKDFSAEGKVFRVARGDALTISSQVSRSASSTSRSWDFR